MGWIKDNFLTHVITYWGNPQADGRGGYTFDAPITIYGRWTEKAKRYVTRNMVEKISTAIVLVESDVEEGGYLALGDYTDSAYGDPADVSSAYRIESFQKTQDLEDDDYVRRAWL